MWFRAVLNTSLEGLDEDAETIVDFEATDFFAASDLLRAKGLSPISLEELNEE